MFLKRKYLKIAFYTTSLSAAVFVTGCRDENPASFMDNYSVNLTEEEGTTYTGNYFPIKEGHTCNYSGSINMQIKMSIPEIENTDTTITTTTNGMLKVLPARSIGLKSGTLSLYPVIELSEIEGSLIADTSRFFMKDNDAVYIKAIKYPDGSYMEVENPVYVKTSLIVGDSWETAPKLDITKMIQSELMNEDLSISNMQLSAKAKFFVVGNESVTVPVGTKTAMRMEQANDISISGTIEAENNGTIMFINYNVNANLAIVYHLVKDTGIIKQNITGPLNMTISMEDMNMSISMTFNKYELGLTDIENNSQLATPLTKRTVKKDAALSSVPSAEQKMMEVAKAIEYGILKGLKF